MAVWPDCRVEIAFTSDPFDDTPTWVDVSADVRENPGVQITRGTVGALGQPITAGTASFLLSNRARLYDPANSAGTYYGQLKARKQVRITATWLGVDYVMFRGFAAGFNVTTDNNGKDSIVPVEAFDLLSIMAATRLSGGSLGAYGEYVAALSPTMWQASLSMPGWNGYTRAEPSRTASRPSILLMGEWSPPSQPGWRRSASTWNPQPGSSMPPAFRAIRSSCSRAATCSPWRLCRWHCM